MQEFQLKVKPLANNDFALELFQCPLRRAGERDRPKAVLIGRIKGVAMIQARFGIYEALKSNSYDPKSLSHRRQDPYVLDESAGVMLALLFQALEPLSNPDKMTGIVQGIRDMSGEEVRYWFAKVSNSGTPALKAIRVLFS